jgi:TRAP-type C4-dicarboxylate transport system permease small subunit
VNGLAAELGESSATPDDVPTSGLLGAVQWVLDRVNMAMALAAALAFTAAGLVLTWEVIGRYFLGIASDWQDELSVFLLVGATFVSAAWTQARRGHVAIDVLTHLLPPALERVRHMLADAAAAVFCGYFTLKCWQMLMEAINDGQISDTAWGPPLWIPYSAMTAGMALLTLQITMQTLAGAGRVLRNT